jgi:signal transduction histidine kinase
MSHELRTPIHAVLGYAALLSDGAGGVLPRTAAEMVGRISRNAQQLRELVDDILELSRLDAGMVHLTLEDIALEPLLRDVMASLEPRALEKRLALHLRAVRIPEVRSDRRRLWQIVLNLVSNAVKFTEHGGVSIELEELPRWIAIHVMDTGSGIAKEDHERVFEDFVQLGSTPGGTGLGLPISRRLARLIGGDITLRSEPGLGSCFTLTLPVATARRVRPTRMEGHLERL